MIAIDTNVVVRFLVQDDRLQARQAESLVAKNKVAVPHTVLLETEWVLRRRYHFSREQIAAAFVSLLGIETVWCPEGEAVACAINTFAQGCDFADAMHATTSGLAVTEFVTFDRDFAKRAAGMTDLPLVRLLGR
jgi:predicted nucleic-acid-binding protein